MKKENAFELDKIVIRGAKENNLKNIDLEIPKFKLVCLTGVSGSGKTSLAMDTVYAEGQRRYVESLSSYARRFLGVLKKPEVDAIYGLSPSIAIDQKTLAANPRSTVGTITEIYDYLRLLFARVGHPHCPKCKREIAPQSASQIADSIISLIGAKKQKRGARVWILSPIVKDRKGEYSKLFANLRSQGFAKVRIDGRVYSLDKEMSLIKTNRHTIDVVVDRFVIPNKGTFKGNNRLKESVETALRYGGGYVLMSIINDASFTIPEFPREFEDHLFSESFACPYCSISLPEIEPRMFSFNSPHGACKKCEGIGTILKVDPSLVYNPKLSVLEGGIFPWANMVENSARFRSILEEISIKHSFSLSTPIEDLSESSLNVLLYGDSNFEGVIKNMERRYKKTHSSYIREEIEKYMYKETCPSCKGARLKGEALSVTVGGKSIVDITDMALDASHSWVSSLLSAGKFSRKEKKIAEPILSEIKTRLNFLLSVGLNYLTLGRSSATLAGGEAQRIRLASQIGSGLSGIVYILDEPSVGLHARDQSRLIKTLKNLRDLGNTVIVVEHDALTMLESDWIVDFGPGAGVKGGYVVYEGKPKDIVNDSNSITGKYLSGKKVVEGYFTPDKAVKRVSGGGYRELKILGCRQHNLKNINVSFPLSKLICVTGVSGSGKSTLINETLYRQLRHEFGLKNTEKPGENDGVLGVEFIDKVVNIDQSPIGKTPRSNPATYTKSFDYIRELFSQTDESRVRGYSKGNFSFNVKSGRCEVCRGEGLIKVEMQFMPDIYVECEACGGKRYTRDVLDIEYKSKNISEILDLTVDEAIHFFGNIPPLKRRLQTLYDVGLGYVKLGQSAPTLSGGEAQRVKLASELSKVQTGRTFYILDEPTTGLHFADVERLVGILKRLVYYGNTVVVVEHNLDIIKNSDHIIDLGPEGGDGGGQIIFSGDVPSLIKEKKSKTGLELKKYLKRSKRRSL